MGLENIEISSLVPDPVTRDINLVEVSTESEEVENLSVIRDNRPRHKDSVTEEVENLSVIRDNRPQHKNSVTEEVENLSVIRDNRPQHKDSVTEEVENLSVIRDNRPQHKILVTEEIVNRDTSAPSPKFVVGRQVIKSDGVYVEGAIQGMKMTFTADTGAARTVVSAKIFHKIPLSKRPTLQKSNILASANGQPLTELGKGVFTIKLGKLTLDSEVIIAEIEDDALLGLDILMKGEGGPADIKLTEGIILLNKTKIPCIQIGQPETLRRVRSADHFVIPPKTEMIIDVFVDRFETDDFTKPQDFLIEPHSYFIETHPVVMASCLVDIRNEVTNKIRLMNPFDYEIQVNQNTVVGEAEKVESQPTTLFTVEDSDEIKNFNPTRRIKLGESKPVTWPTNAGIIRNLSKKGTTDGGKSGVVPHHLINLYNEAAAGRTTGEQEEILHLLQKYSHAFSVNDYDLGLTHLVEHTIDTGDAKPVKQPPRRVPIAFAEEEKKLIMQMQEQGIIRKSSSPWSSPLVLVIKKNGKVRPCVDYRRLNAVTIKDAFPLPRIQDCLDTVAGATIFSTFDLTSGYHQIPVRSEDIHKTAFVTKYGLFEFQTMPFGVCNGPPTCQRLMELVLNGLQWQICLIYLDDIIVFGNNFKDHMQRLDLVLQRMAEAGLKLKPEKCQLLKTEVAFLGHLVSDKGIQPNPDNIAKILAMPPPTTVTEVRQLLGMEKMLERIESRQQKADSETKSVYTTVSTGISYLRGQVRQLERNQQRQLLSQPPQTKKRPARRPLQQSTLAKAQKKQ